MNPIGRPITLALVGAVACVSPAVASAETVLTVQGTQLLPGLPGPMDAELQGSECRGSNVCTPVVYPANASKSSLPAGVAALTKALQGVTKPTTVFAYSQGAEVVGNTLAAMTAAGDAPAANELSLVLIGNPERRYGGINAALGDATMPAVPYQVTDIVRQYDPIGDFPQHTSNLLADANAMAGLLYVHADYANVNVDDPANVTWTEGNTTYVFVPTEDLPLLQPLRRMGLNKLADALNGPLKQMVETGYDRDLPTTAAAVASARAAGSVDQTSVATAALTKKTVTKAAVKKPAFTKAAFTKAVKPATERGTRREGAAPRHRAEDRAPSRHRAK